MIFFYHIISAITSILFMNNRDPDSSRQKVSKWAFVRHDIAGHTRTKVPQRKIIKTSHIQEDSMLHFFPLSKRRTAETRGTEIEPDYAIRELEGIITRKEQRM